MQAAQSAKLKRGNFKQTGSSPGSNPINKRNVIIAAIVLLLLLLAISVVFWRADDGSMLVVATGEATAVMTTKPMVRDGVWSAERPLDELYFPVGLALWGDDLVVADSMADRVQVLDGYRNYRIGMPGQFGFAYMDSGALVDGFRENAMFRKPTGVFVCSNGHIIVADTGNHVIRRIDEEFVITIAGNGISGYQNGREGEVQFDSPRAAVMDANGYIFVADTMNHVIRRIDHDGNVITFAGSALESGYRNGGLNEARFFEPAGLYINEGMLYVADSANHAIRVIDIAEGTVGTIAGNPGEIDPRTGYPAGDYIDGRNTDARFNFPRDIAMLPDGAVLVADSLNHAVRVIRGEYTLTLVGNGQSDPFYYSVENLGLTRPEGIATDGEYLHISDTMNNRIVSVPLTERILEGRPSRHQMLVDTELTIGSRFAFVGDIRVFIGNQRVDMGRVQPWNTADNIFVPIRPLFEALGATVILDEHTNVLSIAFEEQVTLLNLDQDYFILRGVMVTTFDEIVRLFPHRIEWFPEMSLIAISIPTDLMY
ncbi:MAG: hypothetical protein FWF80_06220 [Defluviitaleaceae bacterium]|nr:hypothetical protein [Defluviitaleaceae bacterium]